MLSLAYKRFSHFGQTRFLETCVWPLCKSIIIIIILLNPHSWGKTYKYIEINIHIQKIKIRYN